MRSKSIQTHHQCIILKMEERKKNVSQDSELEDLSYSNDADYAESEVLSDISKNSPRGRPRISEKWTRVLSLNHHGVDDVKVEVLATALLMAANLPRPHIVDSDETTPPLFCPRTFVREQKEIKLDDFKINPDVLMELGVDIS
jgi:hypothetical protein